MSHIESLPVTLLDLLSNTLILYQTAPYLPVASLLALGACSTPFRSLVHSTPQVFRYLDLSGNKSAAAVGFIPIDAGGEIWRNERMDEAVTEDDFYSGPLRGIFTQIRKKNILRDVQTLVLDGLSVTADLVREIIFEPSFNVRILSIREVKNLNELKLMQVLRYSIRPSRPEGTPKLKGLYVFGPRDPPVLAANGSTAPELVDLRRALLRDSLQAQSTGVMSSEGAQIGAQWNQRSQQALSSDLVQDGHEWYQASGKRFTRTAGHEWIEWSETLKVCEGIIAFDAVLCRGPKHEYIPPPHSSPTSTNIPEPIRPGIASTALGSAGCNICHSSPESPAVFGVSPTEQLPLLAPPPLHSSTIRAAQCPSVPGNLPYPRLIVRCDDCLRDRYCERCSKFWCETCYSGPKPSLRTNLQQVELTEDLVAADYVNGKTVKESIKVHLGLCVEGCLVGEMMAGAGSAGMWG
ncbi:MAG: hypothetical protein M1827_005817 [Pycnora praestabilis]|nr:MAG: hypothetical protein M1827_005817 [Pycnora praestabilis]